MQILRGNSCMEHLIYVFIEENNVKCYPNLRQLAKDNTKVPYYSISKLLKTTSLVSRKDYTIAVSNMKWKTKRGFNKKEDDF